MFSVRAASTAQAMKGLNDNFQVAAQNAWVEYTLEDPTHHYDSDTGAFTAGAPALPARSSQQ